jgi:hypothetical protein
MEPMDESAEADAERHHPRKTTGRVQVQALDLRSQTVVLTRPEMFALVHS